MFCAYQASGVRLTYTPSLEVLHIQSVIFYLAGKYDFLLYFSTVNLPLSSLSFPPAGKSCPPLNLLIYLLGGALKRCIFVVLIGVLGPWVCTACVRGCLRRTEEDAGGPGAGLIDGCELPHVGANDQTEVLCKRRGVGVGHMRCGTCVGVRAQFVRTSSLRLPPCGSRS